MDWTKKNWRSWLIITGLMVKMDDQKWIGPPTRMIKTTNQKEFINHHWLVLLICFNHLEKSWEFVSWDYCSHLMESHNPFMFQSPPTRYGSVTKKMGKPRSCFASIFRNSGNLPVLKHPRSCGLEYNIIYPLVMTNIAMENGPFIDGLAIKKGGSFHGRLLVITRG